MAADIVSLHKLRMRFDGRLGKCIIDEIYEKTLECKLVYQPFKIAELQFVISVETDYNN